MIKRIIIIICSMGVGKILKQFISTILKFFKDLHYYGIKIAHYNFWGLFANARLLGNKFNKIIKSKRDSFIYKYLEFKYKDFIYAYKNKDIEIGNNTKKIWCCRWQGEETAPKIVKICINSIRKHKNGYEVIVIDKNNYSKYIDLPDYIIEKNKKGIISITHLSDIIRFGLLSKYDKVMNNGFLKLSYKTRFIEKTKGEKLTNYGYFMETNKFLLN